MSAPLPLALTMGDPAGIGGEITLAAWARLRRDGPAFVALDDPRRLEAMASRLGWDIPVAQVASPEEAAAVFPDGLPVMTIRLPVPSVPGTPDPANAPAVLGSIERAVTLAREGRVGGVVTNPISKATLYRTGFAFPGHTEFLGALTGTAEPPVMLLASPMLRVVPVTIHVSLRRALDTLSTAEIIRTGLALARGLREGFGIAAPRIAVAGLNPHAGEEGAMGDEEPRLVVPAIEALLAQGVDAFGPLPPDTMFTARMRQTYDAALCLYHDQALIPIKTLDMDGGVNVTLGLPIIRTSPDHGTAFGIAGQGIADPGSLIAALRLAAGMAANRPPKAAAA
ncbi:4-hydroxythreonine-4-phosphate dehydrogenase PdxA [Roseomonas xinghualingensis]|uniref:4-hydroxythreonine-4-phosphate dehydrogenase PdxA n=1 Tax=Roseomonas xinghualingensis TaxID=2986475 RepID=UPI0021F1F66F|nr:4-hydroxythreonine-4-phosphate dehydrogenase PdxA [Roseomonas sp. SXEYE001]MCV4208611.1 4-hydroxythreonine-4-phosphate dehydrogenase PdxA [Roseomonas sp. SXEYE001]